MDKLNIENELVNERTLSKLLDISTWTLKNTGDIKTRGLITLNWRMVV